MIEYDVAGLSLLVVGAPGEGKTYFMRHLAAKFDPQRLAAWDPMREFTKFKRLGAHVVQPPNPEDRASFKEFLRSVLPRPDHPHSRFDLVTIDEADMVCVPKRKLEPGLEALSQHRRHYGLAVCYATRRAARIHADVRETLDKMVCFKVTGMNDRRVLRSFCDGVGVEVKRLPRHAYLVTDGREYQLHTPLPAGAK